MVSGVSGPSAVATALNPIVENDDGMMVPFLILLAVRTEAGAFVRRCLYNQNLSLRFARGLFFARRFLLLRNLRSAYPLLTGRLIIDDYLCPATVFAGRQNARRKRWKLCPAEA